MAAPVEIVPRRWRLSMETLMPEHYPGAEHYPGTEMGQAAPVAQHADELDAGSAVGGRRGRPATPAWGQGLWPTQALVSPVSKPSAKMGSTNW